MNENIIISLIKNLLINFYIFIISFKILDKKVGKIEITKITFASIIIIAIYIVTEKYISKLYMITIMYLLQVLFMKLFIREQPIFLTNIISNAIAYTLFGISVLLESPIIMILNVENRITNLIAILIIETILLILFFKIKRFSHGFSFLKNKSNYDYLNIIMVIISVIVILIYCLVGNYYEPSIKRLFICFIILGIVMFVMIQKTLTLYYKQKLLVKNVEDYRKEIEEKNEQINKLSNEKYEISKLNHQFYNRQKALELKVNEFIEKSNIEVSNEISIVQQINDLSKEYSKELEEIKSLDKIPLTGVEEIDDMFKYMQNECKKNNIDFKLQINGNIHHMINKIIPQNKLVTLIGDHIRDAIIAIDASKNNFKSILAILGVKNNCYELCIYDSGIEFEVETLLKLGKEPITTHKESGGSGLGFMTTFETMKITKASLIIEEIGKMSENNYTKAVIVRFDDKNEYKISSYRACEIKKNNEDDRIIINNNNI